MTWAPQFDGWDATVKPENKDVAYTRTREWSFRGETLKWEISIPVSTYEYCSGRHRIHEYGVYIVDPVQQTMLTELSEMFEALADRRDLDREDLVSAVVRFVQSFPYKKDIQDTGHKAYPKYPAETFIHEQGDCEDGTILLGALLDDVGFDVAVIVFPTAQHMLLGVSLETDVGAYLEVEGDRYYTIETTEEGWDVGDLPPTYANIQTKIQLPDETPVIVHDWEATPSSDGFVDVTANVANVGEGPARTLAVQLEFLNRDQSVVANEQLNPIGETLASGDSTKYESRMRIPSNRELKGQMTIGIDRKVHDRSESDWH